MAPKGLPQILDPRWQWFTAAVTRLYAELDDDAQVYGMSVTVASGGDAIVYGLAPGDSEVQRHLVTDVQGAVDAIRASTVDATPNLEEL